jgi:LacI family transcriptional regulator
MARSARRGSQAVTIQAVAERAGVSTMTVSNVVRGGGKMSEDTRQTVLKAIRDLNYVPNLAAQSLASAGAVTLGLIYHNPQNAFLSAMLVGALNAAAARGVQLVVRDCRDRTYENAAESLRSLVRSGSRALLVAPPFCELIKGTPLVAELGVPIASVSSGGLLSDISTVRVDDRAAARAMTELLIERGHRRIGYIAGPALHFSSGARLQGYHEALAAHDLVPDPDLVVGGDFSFDSGLIAARTLLDLSRPPTAIFGSNDDVAAAVVSVALQRNMSLPRDLSVAGFDDTPIAVKIWPPLTTVRQPISDMAEAAAGLLIDAVRHPERAKVVDEVMPFEIVERASTAAI